MFGRFARACRRHCPRWRSRSTSACFSKVSVRASACGNRPSPGATSDSRRPRPLAKQPQSFLLVFCLFVCARTNTVFRFCPTLSLSDKRSDMHHPKSASVHTCAREIGLTLSPIEKIRINIGLTTTQKEKMQGHPTGNKHHSLAVQFCCSRQRLPPVAVPAGSSGPTRVLWRPPHTQREGRAMAANYSSALAEAQAVNLTDNVWIMRSAFTVLTMQVRGRPQGQMRVGVRATRCCWGWK